MVFLRLFKNNVKCEVDYRGVSSGAIGAHISWHVILHDQFHSSVWSKKFTHKLYESIFWLKFQSNDIFSGCQNKKKMGFIIVIRGCVMKSTDEKKNISGNLIQS